MRVRTQEGVTGFRSVDYLARTGPRPKRASSGFGGRELAWPAVTICAMLAGFVVAAQYGSASTTIEVATQIGRLLPWRGRTAPVDAGEALVITANRRDRLTVVATLSPRGYHPLLASGAREALSHLGAHPGKLKLVVVDPNLPDYAVIARALRDQLPARRIIVLKGMSEDVGRMLLERLQGVAANVGS